MYEQVKKPTSSWSPQVHKKTSLSKPQPIKVQPLAQRRESKEMPVYKPLPTDWITNNPIMRSLDAASPQEELEGEGSVQLSTESESIQRQGESAQPEMPSETPSPIDWVTNHPLMRSLEPAPLQPMPVGSVQMGADLEMVQRLCSECEAELAEKEDLPPIQTKLTVGAPGDPYEQEADRVAMQVMSMSAPPESSPQVQRFEEEDSAVQTWSLAQSITPLVQRQVDEPVAIDPLIQRAFQGEETQTSSDLEGRLNASKGGGNALAPEVRAFMEPRFGSDFSAVRVHTGSEAVQMNQELSAQAFTHGSDIYFGAGKSPGNNELTAHELTHVVQQTGYIHTSKVLPRIQRDVQFPPLIGPLSQGLPNFLIGRSLSSREKSVLRPVFGIHLNYWVIRVCEGGLCTPDGISRTVGNIIALEPGFSDDTLIHECAHVWQHQNGVPFGYALSALSAQAMAHILTGSRSAAYDYSLMVSYHIPWRYWNAEQQAKWIEDNKRLPNIAVWATGGWLPVS